MTTITLTPFGLKPVKSLLAAPFNSSIIEMIVPRSDGTAMYINDIVKTVSNSDSTGENSGIEYCTRATPSDNTRGIVVGFKVIHEAENYVYRKANEYRTVRVLQDPFIICNALVNAVVLQTDVNRYIDIDSSGGNISTGTSEVYLDYATISDLGGQFKITKILQVIDNTDETVSLVECLLQRSEILEGVVSSGDLFNRVGTTIVPANAGDDLDMDTGDILATNGDFTGDVKLSGKLTVGGLIDPTGLLLDPQTTTPSSDDGLIYYNDTSKVFKVNQNGTEETLSTISDQVKPKAQAVVATTGNITLSGEQTIDGILTSSSRVLVWQQSAPATNGIYVSNASAWTRATDANTAALIENSFINIESGSTNAGKTFSNTNGKIILGTTEITYIVFQSSADLSQSNIALDNVLFVNKFGNDLAELNYPTGSGAGFITVPSEFPATFVDKDCYMIPDGTTVTDNDPTKTNTGLTFVGPIQISADATNSTWIERDGKSIGTSLCTIGAALYFNYFAPAPYPTIWCFDSATYYFPTGSANYSSVFAPFATAQISGWHYLMRPISVYFDTVQLTPVGTDGCIMQNTTGANDICEYHAKRVFTNSTSLAAGIFRNVSGLNSLLDVYCGDLITPSSTQSVIVAQGGDVSRVSATVNGKIKGKAVTINTGTNLVTITAGDKTELTTAEAAGQIYVMANLDDVASIGSPVSRVLFAGNTFITPNTITDGFRTSGDVTSAYGWFNSIGLGNDGIYHGSGEYGRLPMWNGSGVQTNYFTTVGGEDNLMTLPLDIRGGFKDNSLLPLPFTAIKLADAANKSFNTTNKTIVGAVNEIFSSAVISQQKDRFVTTAGQTAFTSSSTPVAVLGFCYKGVFYIDEGIGKDYTYTGTSFTWLNSGITFALNDVVFIVYNK